MTTTPLDRHLGELTTTALPEHQRPAGLRLPDLLLPLAVAAWVWSVAHTRTVDLGEFGLLTRFPILFYVAIGAVVLSIAYALAAEPISKVRMGLNLAALVTFLYGTIPLLFTEPLFDSQYKYLGVVQYIAVHGRVNQRLDIYQNWAAFMALVAWFDRVAGLATPYSVARWGQLLFVALTLVVLAPVFRALPLTEREHWLCLVLYTAADWLADIFVPQSVGLVLTAGVFVLVLWWLSDGPAISPLHRVRTKLETRTRWVAAQAERARRALARLRRRPLARRPAHAKSWGSLASTRLTALSSRGSGTGDVVGIEPTGVALQVQVIVALAIVFTALVFVHELSPYLALGQLIALALVGRLRPWWLIVLLAAISFAYLAPRFGFLESHYGLLDSFGDFLTNIQAASGNHTGVSHPDVGWILSTKAGDVVSVGLWIVGVVGLWRRWRAGRPCLVFVALVVGPAFVFFLQAYGGEAVLRVYLFTLPWMVCLAASALTVNPARRRIVRVGTAPLVLAGLLAAFMPAYFGGDAQAVMPKGEVNAILAFYRTAKPGWVFAGDTDFPSDLTSRYSTFTYHNLFGPGTPLGTRPVAATDGRHIAQAIHRTNYTDEPSYVILTDTMRAQAKAFGFPNLTAVNQALSHAPGSILLYASESVTIYELPPAG